MKMPARPSLTDTNPPFRNWLAFARGRLRPRVERPGRARTGNSDRDRPDRRRGTGRAARPSHGRRQRYRAERQRGLYRRQLLGRDGRGRRPYRRRRSRTADPRRGGEPAWLRGFGYRDSRRQDSAGRKGNDRSISAPSLRRSISIPRFPRSGPGPLTSTRARSASRARGSTCRRKSPAGPSSRISSSTTCFMPGCCGRRCRALRLLDLDEARVAKLPGVVKVHRDGSFVAVVCEKEYQAVRALEALRLATTWSEAEGLPDIGEWGTWLRSQPSEADESETGQRLPASEGATPVSASYSRPLIAHASIGPSCGLAHYKDGKLTVWSHTQGVYPLKAALAKALNIEASAVHVIHAQGAGCYGHNGADDAATDAAILALALSPRPVRVQWMRDDELAWSPYGAPMSVHHERIGHGGRADRRLDHGYLERPQTGRPGFMGHPNLMPPAYLGNAGAACDLARQPDDVHGRRPQCPGALRPAAPADRLSQGPCAVPHLLAPLARRLRQRLRDRMFHGRDRRGRERRSHRVSPRPSFAIPRARAVIEKVADMADWNSGTETKRGIAFSRYKNTAAYAAIVVEVDIERRHSGSAGLVRNRRRAPDQSGRRREPDRGRNRPVDQLDSEGAGHLRPHRRNLPLLGHLPHPPLRRSP